MTLKTLGLIVVSIPLIALLWCFCIWLVFFLYYSFKEEYFDEQIAMQQYRLNQLKLEGEKSEETT